MPRPSSSLRLGDPAPAFALHDAATDATVSLDTMLDGRRGALVVFHRGMWCPNCRGQLGELGDQMPRLTAAGLGVAAILAQSCARMAATLQRRGVPYPFPLLCDPDRAVIKRYGVWHPIGLDSLNTAHPACFLIDAAQRRIRYAFVGSNQFARAPVDALLAAAS